MRTTGLLVGCVLLGAACGGEGGDATSLLRRPLVGGVDQVDGHTFAPAVAFITFNYPNGVDHAACSGSLVAPDRVLTAAHCLCPLNGVSTIGGTVTFGDTTGHQIAQSWPLAQWIHHPGANVCGSPWSGFTTNDPQHTSDHDVAVLTLGRDTKGGTQPELPMITPIVLSLDNPHLSFGTNSVGHRLLGKFWAVGWGNAFSEEDFEVPDRCLGCGIRRSGELLHPFLVSNRCSTLLFSSTKDPFPQDCWEGELWTAGSVPDGENLEIGHGDSGGPLMFNVDSGATEVIAGVASSFFDEHLGPPTPFPHQSHWATTGGNADFLWSALGLAYTLTLAQQQSGTAVFATGLLNIDDRAHVVNGRLVSTGILVVGNDALTPPILSTGVVQLLDRVTTGNITTTDIVQQTGCCAHTGTITQGVFQKYEPISLPVSFNPPSGYINIMASQALAPGIYGNVTVQNGATLTLSDGMYVFRSFIGNSGTILKIGGTRTWVFVIGGGSSLVLRNKVAANPASLFIGAPNAQYITVGDVFNGTIVAPNSATFDVDMVYGAVFTGAVFSQVFRLHQGEFFQFASFPGRWIPTCTSGGGFQTCS